MSDYPSILWKLTRRLVPALLMGAAGWYLLASARGGWGAAPQLLLGLGCIVLAAVTLASPVAALLAEPFGSLFYPSNHARKPGPVHGIPESKRKRHEYEDAMTDYLEMTAQFPGTLQPYVAMIDIAIVDLHDADRARRLYEQGFSALESEEERAKLTRMYEAIRTRLRDPGAKEPEPLKRARRNTP